MRISDWSSDVCSSDLERALPPSSEPAPAPAGEPTNAEMVEAVRDWIEGSIKAGSQGHAKFEAVVAMNALGIVLRDPGACGGAEDRGLAAALRRGARTPAEPGRPRNLGRGVLAKRAGHT